MFLFEGWVVTEILTLKLPSVPFGSRAGLGRGRTEVGAGGYEVEGLGGWADITNAYKPG